MRSRTWLRSVRSRVTGLHEVKVNGLWDNAELELTWGDGRGGADPPRLPAQRLQLPHQSRNSESWHWHEQP